MLSKASCSSFDYLHGTSLRSNPYKGEANFAKSGTNLRRKLANPRNDCNSEKFVGGAAYFIACTFSACPVGEIPTAEMGVPRYSTLSSKKKNVSGLSLSPQSCNRVTTR